ncbi:hypothetical protein F2Q69_00055671 [Brassica cretica]|uniref:Uncharacterized protein n=1 Tax=Brassica cretica TaxID=69181 RepID=A0A8S9NCJ3_BRACR|nr:hypothetical protein F2Q69_00055671 [Brassica cretica]
MKKKLLSLLRSLTNIFHDDRDVMKLFLFAGLCSGTFQPVSGSPTGPCFRRRAFSWWPAGFASGVLVFFSGEERPALSPLHSSLVLTAALHWGSPGFFGVDGGPSPGFSQLL